MRVPRRLSLALFLIALALFPAGMSAQGADPESVARTYIEAVNAGDLEAVLALFSDDAVVQQGVVCGQQPCSGRASIRRQYEVDVAGHAHATIASSQVTGNTVALRLEIRTDPIRAAGFDRLVGEETIEVRDGKIVALRFAPDTSDPQSAAFLAARAAQARPEFKLGFADLAHLIPEVAGQPLESEQYGPNGDSLQRTTTGLMAWKKADNWTGFTDGDRTWVLGPLGLQVRPNGERFDWERG